jgi:hypothetical protein
MLKKPYWPPMNADERGYKTPKPLFSICVHPLLSAANPIFDFFRSLLDLKFLTIQPVISLRFRIGLGDVSISHTCILSLADCPLDSEANEFCAIAILRSLIDRSNFFVVKSNSHGWHNGYLKNRTIPHFSGTCMLTTPCGDHTQLSSFNPGTFSYFPSAARTCHSTREKFIRH